MINPFKRNKQEAELDEELQSHLEMAIRDRMERGETREQAEIAARREMGNITLIKEVTRDIWGWRVLDQITQDLRYGLRVLRKSPIFTIVAVLSLALGIGANSAIFQLMNAIGLRALPVKDPQELAEVKMPPGSSRNGRTTGNHPSLTYAQWQQVQSKQQVFTGMFAWGNDRFNMAESGEKRFANALYFSGDTFNVLGVQPILGRLFNNQDDQPNDNAAVAILSYPFWQTNYGGSTDVIGKKILFENRSFEIIGVTPPSFFGVVVGNTFDVAVTVGAEKLLHPNDCKLDKRFDYWLGVMGRLKPGVTAEQATAQLMALSPAIFQETLPTNFSVKSSEEYLKLQLEAKPSSNGISPLRKEYDNSLWLLMAITGLVLLIACANLANLMLARANAREREISIRLALGASRMRLIQQLLIESLLLAAMGTMLGAYLGRNLSNFLASFLSTEREPIFFNLDLDWRVLAFTVGLATFTCLLFGLIPALKVTKNSTSLALRAVNKGGSANLERFGLRRILVISQVALSLVLLVGALLFIGTLQNLTNLDLGFKQNGILISAIDLSKMSVSKEQRMAVKTEFLERLRSINGVDSAAEVVIVPMSGAGWNNNIYIDNELKGLSLMNAVSDNYFKTLRIPILSGRDFDKRDDTKSTRVAIVNESFAKKFFNSGNPLGKTFRMEVGKDEQDYLYEIVGLVKDTKYREVRDDYDAIIYYPLSQADETDMYSSYVFSSNLSLTALTNAIKTTTAEFNPNISLHFRVMETQVKRWLIRERLMAMLSGFFGLLATLLANIGLYGVISYMVMQRRNEIGIRMALGADRVMIIRMIMGEAGLLLLIGLIVGAVLSLVLARAANSLLFGLQPNDLQIYAIAISVLATVGLLASYLPAQRAAKLDPMIILRHE